MSEPIDAAAIRAAMDSSVMSLLRHFAVADGLVEEGGFIMVASPVDYPGPMHNAVMRTSSATSATELFDRGTAFFATRGRRFVVWVRRHADRDLADEGARRGFVTLGAPDGAAAMYVAEPFPPRLPPSGIRLVTVRRTTDVSAFVDVIAASFAARPNPQPEAASRALFARTDSLLASRVLAFNAWHDGRAVGAAMVVFDAHRVGNLCWVSTVPSLRGRGVAETLTVTCVNAAFAAGAGMVVLQSSAMGEPMYARMGFVESTRYQRLLSPAVLDGLGNLPGARHGKHE